MSILVASLGFVSRPGRGAALNRWLQVIAVGTILCAATMFATQTLTPEQRSMMAGEGQVLTSFQR